VDELDWTAKRDNPVRNRRDRAYIIHGYSNQDFPFFFLFFFLN
jgi:hypothetical protein